MEASPLQNWVTILEVLAGFISIGAVAGICIGRYLVKRKKPGYKPLLSAKEKIIYSTCVTFGIGLILLGVFFDFSKLTNTQNPDPPYLAGEQPDKGEDGIITFENAQPM